MNNFASCSNFVILIDLIMLKYRRRLFLLWFTDSDIHLFAIFKLVFLHKCQRLIFNLYYNLVYLYSSQLTRSIHWSPYRTVCIYMLSFTFVMVCGIFEWKWIWSVFFYCLFVFWCRWRSHYHEKFGISWTVLTPPHVCDCKVLDF